MSLLDGRGAREPAESDLAVLLAERFDASRARDAQGDTSDARADDAAHHLPTPPYEALGRETDLGTLLEWLGGDDPTGWSPSSVPAVSGRPVSRSRPPGSPATSSTG